LHEAGSFKTICPLPGRQIFVAVESKEGRPTPKPEQTERQKKAAQGRRTIDDLFAEVR
jgi:acyl-CoA hydrolase